MAHVIRILGVGVVLCLDVVDLVAERVRVETERGAVTLAHVQGDVLGIEDFLHRVLRRSHQLRRQTQLAV